MTFTIQKTQIKVGDYTETLADEQAYIEQRAMELSMSGSEFWARQRASRPLKDQAA